MKLAPLFVIFLPLTASAAELPNATVSKVVVSSGPLGYGRYETDILQTPKGPKAVHIFTITAEVVLTTASRRPNTALLTEKTIAKAEGSK